MSKPTDPEQCRIDACMVRFNCITEKLQVMHEDMTKLSEKISNGLSVRISQVENHVDLLQRESARRESFYARIQTLIVGILIVLSTSAIFWAVRHYADHNGKPAITQPKTP